MEPLISVAELRFLQFDFMCISLDGRLQKRPQPKRDLLLMYQINPGIYCGFIQQCGISIIKVTLTVGFSGSWTFLLWSNPWLCRTSRVLWRVPCWTPVVVVKASENEPFIRVLTFVPSSRFFIGLSNKFWTSIFLMACHCAWWLIELNAAFGFTCASCSSHLIS